MDPLLQQFYRQYLQQVINLTYPPSQLLAHPDIQDQIYRYFFNHDDSHQTPVTSSSLLPPPEYQRRVLKKLIDEITKEIQDDVKDDDDDKQVSDELMGHMGYLSSLPQQSEFEMAQTPRLLSYFLPLPHLPSGEDTDTHINRILIRESPQLLAAGSNVGLRTWEACLRLGWYLCTHLEVRDQIRDKNVLELGAGTGLLSLVCALGLGAKWVLATDGLGHVVEGVERNIAVNTEYLDGGGGGKENRKKGTEERGMPSARVLDWTDLTDLDQVLSLDGGGGRPVEFDYVLGADITYHPELLGPLASLLAELKRRFPKCKVLISATVRNERTTELWRRECENRGLSVREVNEVDDRWRCPEYRAQTGLFHDQAFPIIIMDITTSA